MLPLLSTISEQQDGNDHRCLWSQMKLSRWHNYRAARPAKMAKPAVRKIPPKQLPPTGEVGHADSASSYVAPSSWPAFSELDAFSSRR